MTLVLQDKIFISTRPKENSDDLIEMLHDLGAQVVEFPMIEITALNISDEAAQFIKEIKQFQWIIFTSANGVIHFFRILKELTGSHFLDQSIQFAVIGSKTEAVLQEYGYMASFINPGATAEEFAPSFKRHISEKGAMPNLLLPFGDLARTVIQDHLKEVANCIRINVYKTEVPDNIDENTIKQIETDRYDMILFTSPSGVRNFLKINSYMHIQSLRIACIGAVTEREALSNGIKPKVTAQVSTTEGLVESIINYYISKK